jgi:hypothetical protein
MVGPRGSDDRGNDARHQLRLEGLKKNPGFTFFGERPGLRDRAERAEQSKENAGHAIFEAGA